MTSPSHGPQTASTASAIRAEALPAPTTTTLDCGFEQPAQKFPLDVWHLNSLVGGMRIRFHWKPRHTLSTSPISIQSDGNRAVSMQIFFQGKSRPAGSSASGYMSGGRTDFTAASGLRFSQSPTLSRAHFSPSTSNRSDARAAASVMSPR